MKESLSVVLCSRPLKPLSGFGEVDIRRCEVEVAEQKLSFGATGISRATEQLRSQIVLSALNGFPRRFLHLVHKRASENAELLIILIARIVPSSLLLQHSHLQM
jgi:hypothetical protein